MKIVTDQSDTLPNILVYGPAGTGKSMAPVTFSGKTLLLQLEPGLVAALTDEAAKKRLTAIRIEDWKDISEIRRGVPEWLKKNNISEDFDLLMIDSVTELQEMALRSILKEFPSKQKDGLPEQQHYGMLRERVRQVLYAISHSTYGTYVTCQALLQDVGTKDNIQTIWMASLIGKLKSEIKHLFDWQFFSRKMNGKFELITEETADSFGKSRGVNLPRVVPFNLDELFKLWKDSIK